MLEYLYGKRFGLKIAWADTKEGDRVGAVQNTLNRSYRLPPSYRLRLFSSQTFSRTNTPTFLKSSHTLYLPAYEDGTVCSKMSAYKIQTPGNYPEESIQYSEHSESLKSRILKTYSALQSNTTLFSSMNHHKALQYLIKLCSLNMNRNWRANENTEY